MSDFATILDKFKQNREEELKLIEEFKNSLQENKK